MINLMTYPTPAYHPLLPYTTLFRSEPGREEREPEASGVAEHVPRVGKEGERARGVTRDHLDDREGCDERERRSEEHTSELQSPCKLVCRLLLEKKEKRHRTVGQADQ